jgi:hypothetical protein
MKLGCHGSYVQLNVLNEKQNEIGVVDLMTLSIFAFVFFGNTIVLTLL